MEKLLIQMMKRKINIPELRNFLMSGFIKNIDDFQNLLKLSGPINKSLNINPIKIDPNAKITKGMIITKGDSCISSIETFGLLNFP